MKDATPTPEGIAWDTDAVREFVTRAIRRERAAIVRALRGRLGPPALCISEVYRDAGLKDAIKIVRARSRKGAG